jgi:hypothetical protein
MTLEHARSLISDTYGKYRISTDSINPELMEEFAKTLQAAANLPNTQAELLKDAETLLSDVSSGNWNTQKASWRDAATIWKDKYTDSLQ